MTSTREESSSGLAQSSLELSDSTGLDPEDDSVAALNTLRGYLLDEFSGDASQSIEDWHGLNAYIGDLCSFGIDNLSREPDALALEYSRTRGQLEDVSCRNYRALIESFECASAVRDGVGSVRSQLNDLISVLPPLAAATRQFSADAANAQSLREEKLRTLAEHGRVVDILEMPRLMKALVAGELYEEALELQNTSMKFLSIIEDEDIVSSVCNEVVALIRQMVLQLVSLLRGPVQLPTSLRVIGYLRRLEVFSESRLRMLFLQCRGDWLRASLDSSVSPNAQAKLVRLSDDTRAMLFEIVTQYRAAFADDDDASFRSFRFETAAHSTPGLDSSEQDGAVFCASILSDWTASCAGQYLERLEEGLCDVHDGASLGTVLQQAMYCGQSLGRVGADFRPALAPLFESAVLGIFNSHLISALRQFEMMIEDHRWAPVGSSALRKGRERGDSTLPLNDNDEFSNSARDETNPSSVGLEVESEAKPDSRNVFEPPVTVLDSPSLAVFLNGVIAALNELRPCALSALSTEVADSVMQTLLQAAECVSAVGGPGGAFLKVSDRPHFASMRASLRDLCVPHIARCLDQCMDRRGLLNVGLAQEELALIFGEEVPLFSKTALTQSASAHAVAAQGSSPLSNDGTVDGVKESPAQDVPVNVPSTAIEVPPTLDEDGDVGTEVVQAAANS